MSTKYISRFSVFQAMPFGCTKGKPKLGKGLLIHHQLGDTTSSDVACACLQQWSVSTIASLSQSYSVSGDAPRPPPLATAAPLSCHC